MWRADLMEKTLMLGKTEGKRRRERQRRWLDSITNSTDMNLSKLRDSDGQGSLACYSLWGCKGSDATQWLNNKGIAHLGFLWGLNKTIMKQYSTVSGKWVKAIRSIFFITATISANIWANYFTSLGSVSIPLKR